MHQAHITISPPEHFSVNILLENSKAGRVIGTKGTTIQGIKNKSGAQAMRLHKDPQEFYGVLLRMLNIEGHLSTIKRLVDP
jgi:hypothetical protein